MLNRVTTSLITLSIFVITATPGIASASPLEELLIEKGLITEEELNAVRAEASRNESAKADAAKEAEQPKVDISVGPKGLLVSSPGKDFSLGIGGRLQFDAGAFSGGLTPLGDGVQLRRGRVKVFGTVYEDWDYKLEVNFDSGGSVSPTDAWIRYSGFKPITLVIGHQKVPFSQQSMTSSNWQVFQERALQDALIDTGEQGRRRLGAVLGAYGEHWNVYAGAFGEGLTNAGAVNEDWGTAGRAVIAPFAEPGRVLTFGGAVYYREFESMPGLRYSAKPESSLASVRLVDTAVLGNAAATLGYNAEISLVCGPFHAQGEYTRVNVDRRMAPSLSLDGWYVQSGFFITGESRNYDVKSGKYKRIKPTRKLGAWEVAARYSTLDLDSREIAGGQESNVTAGLNWWVNQSIVFRFNYVHAMLDPTSTAVVAGGGFDQKVNAFMGRAQIAF